jgi:hypothetical protein
MFLKTKGAGFNSPFIGHETCCWVHHTVLVMKQYSIFLKSSKFIALTLEIHSSLAHHTRQVSNLVTSEAYLSNLTFHHWKISYANVNPPPIKVYFPNTNLISCPSQSLKWLLSQSFHYNIYLQHTDVQYMLLYFCWHNQSCFLSIYWYN